MASNINPSLTPVNSLTNFKFWCQKVLPLVYDDSLSYYEVLGKMVVQLNDVIDNVNADTENVLTLKDAFLELQTYVNNFFDDIDQLASYAERAEAAQTAANTSAVNAATSASNASASSLAAMDARDTAVTAKQAAETSASTASTASTNATTKASEAAQSAITAQTAQASASQSATLAATDRSAAQTAASTATTKASEASASASNAQTSAENAEQSKDDAEELVNSVQESLDNIQQNTQDIADLKETIENTGTAIINSISGKLAHFTDGARNTALKSFNAVAEATKAVRIGKNIAEPKFWGGVQYNAAVGGTCVTNPQDITNTVTKDGNTYSKNSGPSGWNGSICLIIPIAAFTGKSLKFSGIFNFPNSYRCYYYVTDANFVVTRRSSSFNEAPTWLITNIAENEKYLIWDMNSSAKNVLVSIENPMVEVGTTATDFKVYEATEYTLNDGVPSEDITTLYGVNNIYADTGEITIEYTADTKLYIDNKIAELQATMLENIGG